jgi:hypothetical protein
VNCCVWSNKTVKLIIFLIKGGNCGRTVWSGHEGCSTVDFWLKLWDLAASKYLKFVDQWIDKSDRKGQ